MWPFSKKISQELPSVPNQIALSIKSITLPEAQPQWRLFARKDTLWDIKTAILEGYNASAAVYTCVEKRASLVASVPWYAARTLSDGTVERLPQSHPLNKLIARPNGDFSWLEMMHEFSQSLDLAGNAYASIVRGGASSQPSALWVLQPAYVKARQGRTQLIDSYEFQLDGGTKHNIASNDMLHLKQPNPNNPIFGMPTLMAAGRATDIDRESGNWQKASLQNKSASSLHVEVPPETQPDQVEAIQQAIADKYSGSANADKPIVSSGKINHLTRTAQEMDFVNSRKAVWAEICAVFGLSMSDLGFTESVNLANAEAMARQLWKNTIIPRLNMMRAQLNMQLAIDFGDDVIIQYDISGVDALQENYTELLDNATKLWQMGFSLEAINKRLNLGFDDDELPTDMSFDEPEQVTQSQDEEVKRLLKSVTYGA